jgi:hypothetical protein
VASKHPKLLHIQPELLVLDKLLLVQAPIVSRRGSILGKTIPMHQRPAAPLWHMELAA